MEAVFALLAVRFTDDAPDECGPAPISTEEDAKCSRRDAWGRIDELAACGDRAKVPTPLQLASAPTPDEDGAPLEVTAAAASVAAVGDGIHMCVDVFIKGTGETDTEALSGEGIWEGEE